MMLTQARMRQKLEQVFERRQAEVLAEVVEAAYADLVKTGDFNELKGIVKELAQAQQRTETRMEELTQAQQRTETRMEELAQAQQRTETRMEELAQAQQRTETRMEELAHAQQRTETRVEELAQAQQRTEMRVEELAHAQQRTETRVEELAQAQQRTEVAVQRTEAAVQRLADAQRQLAQDHAETRRQLGGLTATVGYTLENEAFKALPALLTRDYGLTVTGRLRRGYVTSAAGQPLEINVLGQATRDAERLTIVGESKAQLSKNKVDSFIREVLRQLPPDVGAVFPLLVTHMISEPEAEAYARQQGIAVYYSYDF
jgi:hypothetical protein